MKNLRKNGLFLYDTANPPDEVDLCKDNHRDVVSPVCTGKYRKQLRKKQTYDDQINLRDRPVEHREVMRDFIHKFDKVKHGDWERG